MKEKLKIEASRRYWEDMVEGVETRGLSEVCLNNLTLQSIIKGVLV